MKIFFRSEKKSFGHSRDILAFSYCCEATRLRSRLIQVAYVTSLRCLCPKYTTALTTAFASIQVSSSRSMLFCLHSIEFQKENLKNTRENLRPRRYPVSFRKPRFYKRRVWINASEGKKFPWIEAIRFSEYFELSSYYSWNSTTSTENNVGVLAKFEICIQPGFVVFIYNW